MTNYICLDTHEFPEQIRCKHHEYGYNVDTKGWVYLCHTKHGYKIGRSKNLKSRMLMLQKDVDSDLRLMHYIEYSADRYILVEKLLHEIFAEKNNGYRLEYFDLSKEDIEYFKSEEILEHISIMIKDDYNKKRSKRINDATKPSKKILKKIAKLEYELELEKKKLKRERSEMVEYNGWLSHYNITNNELHNELDRYKNTL